MATPILTIVWAPHEGRTAMFARQLNAPLHNIHYLLYKRPYVAPFKYIAQALKTWWVLARQRPRYVYVTNPPVFATMCVFAFCKLTGTRFIMDTHPPALYSRKWGWSVPLQRLMARFAYVNVVDQNRFKTLFESWGARAVVLQNPPKNPPFTAVTDMSSGFFDITVVNTFAADEPLDIILQAAKQLPDVRFFVLGNKQMAPPDALISAPKNVIFTDYLLGDAYWSRLANSRAVMVLTTYPYSLLGGAQDGVALRKPLILSNQPALTEYFTKGTVFIENTVEGIITGVQTLQAREDTLKQEVQELADEQCRQWEANFQQFKALLEQ
ncbi:MAG: hypothetical protein HZC41_07950 [Chloroflexi bacterium]|nr:hypothetical protein [Chloroflexota bacterium]